MENETIIMAVTIVKMTESARERGCDPVVCASPETLLVVGRLCQALGIRPPSVLTRH